MRFSCTLCGDCCTGGQVVRLAGGDLQILVRRLGLPSLRSLGTEGLVRIVRESAGPAVWRPRIRFRQILRPRRSLRQCPFLLNTVNDQGQYQGLCSLHPEAKPLVCALSPLSREVDDPGTGPVGQRWSFVPPVDGCPGVGRGDPLVLGPPEDLRGRLAEEVAWMRALIRGSQDCDNEAQAWDLIESLGSAGPL